MTGAAKGTVLRLLADLGEVCAAYHNDHVHNVAAKRTGAGLFQSLIQSRDRGSESQSTVSGQETDRCNNCR
jgi:hypothetical protein